MIKNPMLAGALLLLSSALAVAGPCNTANRDACSGPVTTGKAIETTGVASAKNKEHPSTSAMNKATDNTATSSQDRCRVSPRLQTACQAGAR